MAMLHSFRNQSGLTPNELKAGHSVRFHHMITNAGRLVATLATIPVTEEDVEVAAAVVAPGDSPSRFRGRQIALGRIEVGKTVEMPLETLKERIRNRSILAEFVKDKLAQRMGYIDTNDLIADIRTPLPFVGPASEDR